VFVDFTAGSKVRDLPVQQEKPLTTPPCWPTWTPKVVLLRADWTRRDPAVTAALSQLPQRCAILCDLRPGCAPWCCRKCWSVDDVRAELAEPDASAGCVELQSVSSSVVSFLQGVKPVKTQTDSP
jgi:thiol:disulfide interchange protein DsbD